MKYRPEIDGLRALAVLSVVLYHAGLPWVSGGFVGVDIFFVISGYLITGIILRELKSGHFSFAKFYERRCRRILPPLVVMALVVTIVCWFVLMPPAFRDMGKSLAAMITLWANIYFNKTTGYFEAVSVTKPLLHTWSLSVEEQFYLIFPPLLFLLFRHLRKADSTRPPADENRYDRRIFLILATIALLSLGAGAVMIERNPSGVFYLSQYRAWELMIDSLLALSPIGLKDVVPGRAQTIFSIAALILMLVPVFLYDHSTNFPAQAALPPCLGAGLFIFAHKCGLTQSPIGRFMGSAIPVAIGKISYSLYLWHWPLLAIPAYIREEPLSISLRLILVAVSALLAALSWRFVEQPIRAKKVFQSRKRVFQAAFAAMIILAVSGRVIKMGEGFPERLNPEEVKYASAAKDIGAFSINRIPKGRLAYVQAPWRDDLVKILGNSTAWPPSFLIIGDSHARDWAIGFDQAARQLGISGIFVSTVGLPLPDTLDRCMLKKSGGVISNNDLIKAAEDIIKAEGIRNVIISGYYRRAIGEPLAKEAWEANPCLSPNLDYQSPEAARMLFSRQLEILVDSLASLGSHVWLMSSLPDFNKNVPLMLALAVRFNVGIENKGYTRDNYYQQNRLVNKLAQPALGKPAVSLVDVSEVFCPGQWCPAGDQDGAFYRNTNHLSVHGRHWAQDFMLNFLKRITADTYNFQPPEGAP